MSYLLQQLGGLYKLAKGLSSGYGAAKGIYHAGRKVYNYFRGKGSSGRLRPRRFQRFKVKGSSRPRRRRMGAFRRKGVRRLYKRPKGHLRKRMRVFRKRRPGFRSFGRRRFRSYRSRASRSITIRAYTEGRRLCSSVPQVEYFTTCSELDNNTLGDILRCDVNTGDQSQPYAHQQGFAPLLYNSQVWKRDDGTPENLFMTNVPRFTIPTTSVNYIGRVKFNYVRTRHIFQNSSVYPVNVRLYAFVARAGYPDYSTGVSEAVQYADLTTHIDNAIRDRYMEQGNLQYGSGGVEQIIPSRHMYPPLRLDQLPFLKRVYKVKLIKSFSLSLPNLPFRTTKSRPGRRVITTVTKRNWIYDARRHPLMNYVNGSTYMLPGVTVQYYAQTWGVPENFQHLTKKNAGVNDYDTFTYPQIGVVNYRGETSMSLSRAPALPLVKRVIPLNNATYMTDLRTYPVTDTPGFIPYQHGLYYMPTMNSWDTTQPTIGGQITYPGVNLSNQ